MCGINCSKACEQKRIGQIIRPTDRVAAGRRMLGGPSSPCPLRRTPTRQPPPEQRARRRVQRGGGMLLCWLPEDIACRFSTRRRTSPPPAHPGIAASGAAPAPATARRRRHGGGGAACSAGALLLLAERGHPRRTAHRPAAARAGLANAEPGLLPLRLVSGPSSALSLEAEHDARRI